MTTVKKREDFEKIEVTDLEGAKNVEKEVLLGENEKVENFVMRRFSLDKGGHTPYHCHDWEHEVYILKGVGRIKLEDREEKLLAGDVVYVPSGEKHQFLSNREGMNLLCLVPKRGEPTISQD